ncbi:MAG: hypothetical protein AAF663_09530, partial [Planctomycetota bacterium]
MLIAGCNSGPDEVEPGIRNYVAVGNTEPAALDAYAELLAYDTRESTKLPAEYLLRQLRERESGSAIEAAFFEAAARDTAETRAALVRAIELDFVHGADTSSLDLLGAELSERFRGFAWERFDYPGGTEGPNEERAMLLADALDAVTPERRANRAAVAVIVRDEATDAIWEYMLAQWRDVPGEVEQKLNRHALPAYVAMREAAAEDGVDLTILSGHR